MNIRAALWLERAGPAVLLARKVDHRPVLCQPVAWLDESAVVFPQLFAAGADIEVAHWIECEVAAGECPGESYALTRGARQHISAHCPIEHLAHGCKRLDGQRWFVSIDDG